MRGLGWLRTQERLRLMVPAWAAALVVPAILLLTGCEAPGVPHPLAEAELSTQATVTPAKDEPPKAPTTTPGADGGEAPTPADGSGGLVLEGSVEVEQSDFKLTPNEFTVKAGEVSFVFTNTGRYTHDFRIEGQGIDVKAPKNGARRTREWSTPLAPGTYRISCPISNHDQRGMEGTMVVVE